MSERKLLDVSSFALAPCVWPTRVRQLQAQAAAFGVDRSRNRGNPVTGHPVSGGSGTGDVYPDDDETDFDEDPWDPC